MPTINIREIDAAAHARIKRAAGARGWNIAQYLEALTELHRRLLAGDSAAKVLKELGLEAAE